MAQAWDPQYPPPQQHDAKDVDHLKLLSIGYYVGGALSFLFGLIPIAHVTMGLAMLTGRGPFASLSAPTTAGAPPTWFGWFFVIFGAVAIVFGLTMAVLNLLTARRLAARRGRIFCIVVGAINCIHVPLGTLLGVFTIVVLSRPSVRALFGEAPA